MKNLESSFSDQNPNTYIKGYENFITSVWQCTSCSYITKYAIFMKFKEGNIMGCPSCKKIAMKKINELPGE